jgi:hypothetical protein
MRLRPEPRLTLQPGTLTLSFPAFADGFCVVGQAAVAAGVWLPSAECRRRGLHQASIIRRSRCQFLPGVPYLAVEQLELHGAEERLDHAVAVAVTNDPIEASSPNAQLVR